MGDQLLCLAACHVRAVDACCTTWRATLRRGRFWHWRLEGHAPSWPYSALVTGRPWTKGQRTRPQRVAAIRLRPQAALVPYGVTSARFARMFAIDLEGHALSWPYSALVTGRPWTKGQRTRPQRVPPFGCGRRPLWALRVTLYTSRAQEQVILCRKKHLISARAGYISGFAGAVPSGLAGGRHRPGGCLAGGRHAAVGASVGPRQVPPE